MGGSPWSPWCLLPNGRYPGYLLLPGWWWTSEASLLPGTTPWRTTLSVTLYQFPFSEDNTLPWQHCHPECTWKSLRVSIPSTFSWWLRKTTRTTNWETTSFLLWTTSCHDNTAILNVLGNFCVPVFPVPFHGDPDRQLGHPIWKLLFLLRTTPCYDNTAILNVLGYFWGCYPSTFS